MDAAHLDVGKAANKGLGTVGFGADDDERAKKRAKKAGAQKKDKSGGRKDKQGSKKKK
jgi:hypothetical protein